MDFKTLKRKIIEKDFQNLNDMQFEAVVTTRGPLLILAGAGSGKTTVLINRIAYLIKYGNAYFDDTATCTPEDFALGERYLNGEDVPLPSCFRSHPAAPWRILAITFTNKAAGELKERITRKLGGENDVVAGTFHSVCAKILRVCGDRLGYDRSFTIYDTTDQKSVIKEVLKELGLSEKELPPKLCAAEISKAKEGFLSPADYAESAGAGFVKRKVAKVYEEYQKHLRADNAMDFDDLIVNTVRLFEENPDVLGRYAERFEYVMVDEYQDTNLSQYRLVSLLSSVHKNLCVVGDDDQSIYSFRGATIENILSFERQFKGAKVIRLEQNYRSTKTILDAANAVIANNKGRKGKTLWTSKQDDSKIKVTTLENERGEAMYLAEQIMALKMSGEEFKSCAVLYRMNAQSNAVESVFTRSGIPYRIIGGHRFYDRKEIKDVMSYLSLINNPRDNVRLRRIINQPKRGIGDTTLTRAEGIAADLSLSTFEILKDAENYPVLSRCSQKIGEFCAFIESMRELSQTAVPHKLLEAVLDKSGYMDMLIAEGDTGKERIENVNELISNIISYENETDTPTLAEFLEETALISDIDNYDRDADCVTLMTLHSAKGLEFDNVFLIGLEEGIFPGTQSVYGGESEIEEERRIAYVGITRGKKRLFITNAYTRLMFGTTNRHLPSRFLEEIPKELCDIKGFSPTAFSFGEGGSYQKDYSHLSDGSYQNTKSSFVPKSAPRQPSAVFTVGQSVKHKVFGEGVIINATPMGGDTLLEIAFSQSGTKRIMANYAKLEHI